ncbi:MAG: class I adenylate-forming enzyme family protein [Paracoccaceae bacterium]
MNISLDIGLTTRTNPFEPGESAMSMTAVLDRLAKQMGSGVAAIDEDGSVTFSEMRDRSQTLARVLAGAGVLRGDRIGLLAGNGIDWLTVAFGVAAAGAILVPFSTWSTRDELAYLLSESDCRILFVTSDFEGRDFTTDVAELTPQDGPRLISLECRGDARFTPMEVFLGGITAVPNTTTPDDDAMVLYTSGSTSRPKGVRLTRAGVADSGLHIGDRMGLRPGDVVFLPAPLFWAFGGSNALPAALTHGATLVLPSRFEPDQALDLIERHRCTALYTLPAITSALLRHPEFRSERTASLRTGLTIGSPEEFRMARDQLGIPELCNIYGATETYGNCAVTWHHWPANRRAGCQGPMLPGQLVRFRDPETGKLCPSGVTGLAEISGRVSPGYFGQSEVANGAAFTEDGYYRTGDLGYLDAEGAFVFVGRASEMIKRAGINVSPAEVEDALMKAPGVAAAAVTGVPDAEKDERIVAYVVGTGLNRATLNAHCRSALSKYKLPDWIDVVDALPLTATGKLQRKALKQMAIALMKREQASEGPAS